MGGGGGWTKSADIAYIVGGGGTQVSRPATKLIGLFGRPNARVINDDKKEKNIAGPKSSYIYVTVAVIIIYIYTKRAIIINKIIFIYAE